ncbi:MAG: hypothetical protein Q6373_012250 [Candidatus Sigynarchaeota archaeon]
MLNNQSSDGLGLNWSGTTIATISTTREGGRDPGACGAAPWPVIATIGVAATYFVWYIYKNYIPAKKPWNETKK